VSQPTTATATPPRSAAGSRKYGPLTRNQWIAVGVVFAAVTGYLIWKRKQNAASSSSSANQASAATTADTGCTDPSGNPIPCADAQLLSELETELQTAMTGENSSGAGGGSVGTGAVGTGTAAGSAGTSGSTTTTMTGATTSTGTATAPAAAGPISNLQAASVGTTTATVKWNAATGATSGYSYILTDITANTKRAAVRTTATQAALTGLTAGHTYNFGVQALPGGAGNNIHFTTKKS